MQTDNTTPDHWRHVRVKKVEGGYSVLTFYCHGRIGPMTLIALGFDGNTKTETIPLDVALKLGAGLEAALVKMNGGSNPEGRRRRG